MVKINMNIIIANSVGRIKDNHYICPFPSRWTSIIKDYPTFTFYPYELAYLSSLLKRDLDGAHVELVDGAYLRFNVEEYIRYLSLKKPDWIIFELDTVTYSVNLRVALSLKKEIGSKIIMTGQYPTAFPEQSLKDGADFVCIGEYEYTVLDILKGDDPKNIKGLFPNGHRPLLDINSLPFPEDEDIKRIDYSYPGGCRWTKYREIEFHAGRGCPYQCAFCVAGSVYYEKPNWRMRSVDNIISEIKYLKDRYPEMEGLFFNEETHVIKKKAALGLCRAIIEEGLNNMHYEAMANYMALDEEIIEAMAKAGYYKLRIGIETLDEKAGDSIGVKVDEDKLRNVLTCAKENKIEIYAAFLIGAPGSTNATDKKTIERGEKLIAEGLIGSYQASIAVPHAGTPFYKQAEEKGWFVTTDLEAFNGIYNSVVEYPDYKGDEISNNMKILHKKFDDAIRDKIGIAPRRSFIREQIQIPEDKKQQMISALNRASGLVELNNYDDALIAFENIIKIFPQSFSGHYQLASLYIRLKKFKEAEATFKKVTALSLDYDDALTYASGAHFYLAMIRLFHNDKDGTIRELNKCNYLNPCHKLGKYYFWVLTEHKNALPLTPVLHDKFYNEIFM